MVKLPRFNYVYLHILHILQLCSSPGPSAVQATQKQRKSSGKSAETFQWPSHRFPPDASEVFLWPSKSMMSTAMNHTTQTAPPGLQFPCTHLTTLNNIAMICHGITDSSINIYFRVHHFLFLGIAIETYIRHGHPLCYAIQSTGWWFEPYPSEKWWSSSVGVTIPNIWKIIKFMFQTTNQIITMENHHVSMGKSTISMAMFHIYVHYKWSFSTINGHFPL